MGKLAFRGNVVSTPEFGKVVISKDQLLITEDAAAGGRILSVAGSGTDEEGLLAKAGLKASDVLRLKVRFASMSNSTPT